MTNNPYAPPKANVDGIANATAIEMAPPLWNPKAAVGWSLLFSPVFGALVHMKNWHALGEPDKAAQSKNWAVASGVFLLAVVILAVIFPESKAIDVATRPAGLAMLIAWYTASAKHQSLFVAERFGGEYPRRGWGLPLLYAGLVFVAFLVAVFAIAMVAGMLSGEN